MRRWFCLVPVAVALCATACGGEDPADPPGDAGPPAFRCDFQQPLDGGVACAVAPSATKDGTSDAFGHHAIGVPEAMSAQSPLFVFLRGTDSVPFDANTSEYEGTTLSRTQEAVAHGALALVIAYDNTGTVGSICGEDLDCYEAIRREVVEGIEAGDPDNAKDVHPPDDVMSRVDSLVAHLHGMDPGRFPAAIDWASATVGGGSQGAGHAAFIARTRKVARACMLAGPADGNAMLDPATWIVAGDWLTPTSALRGVIHQDDPWFDKVTTNWAALGLLADEGWRKLVDVTDDPHGYVGSSEPAPSAARLWACHE